MYRGLILPLLRVIGLFLLLPIGIVVTLLGFIMCWKCHKLFHVFTMKRHTLIFDKERVHVCKDCKQDLMNQDKLLEGFYNGEV